VSGTLPPEGLRITGAYLAWHFVACRDQRSIQDILAEAYEHRTERETA
jgi:hypothetical protein